MKTNSKMSYQLFSVLLLFAFFSAALLSTNHVISTTAYSGNIVENSNSDLVGLLNDTSTSDNTNTTSDTDTSTSDNTNTTSDTDTSTSDNETNTNMDDHEDSTNDADDQTDKEDDKIHDEDDDGIDDEVEKENERELQIETENDYVHISSESKNADTKNEYEIEMNMGGELSMELQYSSDVSGNETELELELAFSEVLEYLDVNENGIYDKDNDTLLQVYELDVFKPVQYSTQTLADNSTLHVIEVWTDDGVFGVRSYISETFVKMNSTVISPAQLKMDIMFNNFPFSSNTSRLALRTELRTQYEFEAKENEESEDEKLGIANEEKEVEIEMNGVAAGFSWAKFAEVDNQTLPVLANNLSSDEVNQDTKELYLNYPHGDIIFHDPKIGVKSLVTIPTTDTTSDSAATSTIPGYDLIGFISFTIIALFVAGLVNKRKIKNIR